MTIRVGCGCMGYGCFSTCWRLHGHFLQITIEGEAMAIWYFSRSHSVMSKPFDFTEVSIGPIYTPHGWMISDRIQGNLSLYSLCNQTGDGVWSYCPPHHIRRQDPLCLRLDSRVRQDVAFSNDKNDLQPPDCVHQQEEDVGIEGDPSYWLGWLTRERQQRSCIKRCLAWQGFSERKGKPAINIR